MKRCLSFIFCAVLILVSMAAPVNADVITQINGNNNTIVFNDVGNEYGWAKDAIDDFSKKGIVQGVGDGKFAPDESVTREQFAKMLVLTYSVTLPTLTDSSFSDVPVDKWSAPYIEVCKNFLTGYANPFGGKPLFRPEDDATREDIAVALVKIIGLSASDLKDPNYVSNTFSDASDISPGLVNYVGIAAERGLIKGYDDRTFRPQKPISRAEAVVLLYRATKQAIAVIESTPTPTATIMITATATPTPIEFNRYYMPKRPSDPQIPVIVVAAGLTSEGKITDSLDVPLYVLGESTESTVQEPTIAGAVYDSDGNDTVFVNGYNVGAIHNEFFITCTLNTGANVFNITAINKFGKIATKQITITYNGNTPIFYPKPKDGIPLATVTPEATPANTPNTAVETATPEPTTTPDTADTYVPDPQTTFTPTIIDEMTNKIVTKSDDPLAPKIYFDKPKDKSVPEYVTTEEKGCTAFSASDENDNKLKVDINGKLFHVQDTIVYVYYDLKPGVNVFIITVTNKYGISVKTRMDIIFGNNKSHSYLANVKDTLFLD